MRSILAFIAKVSVRRIFLLEKKTTRKTREIPGKALLGTASFPTADWRSQRKVRGEGAFVGSGNKVMPLSEKDRRIKELEAELRETKRANDILKEALGFFAQSRKK